MPLAPLRNIASVTRCRSEPTDAQPFKQARCRELLERWHELRRRGRIPSYDDFRPDTMWDIVGQILIADVESRDNPVFRFRLFGTKATQIVGYDMTGKTVGDYPSIALADMVQRDFESVVRSRVPRADHVTLAFGDAPFAYRRLLLPLSSDGTTVDAIFSASEWD